MSSPWGPDRARASRVGEQHQREEALRPRRRPAAGGAPSRVSRIASFAEVAALQRGAAAARVSLVEDQVEHVEHGLEPLRALLVVGIRNGTPDALMRLLGPADPLRHRRLRHQERARDLRGREPADGAQRERDRRRCASAPGDST